MHCEYRASKGVDYWSIPLQCIGSNWGDFGMSVILVWAWFRVGSNGTKQEMKLIAYVYYIAHEPPIYMLII